MILVIVESAGSYAELGAFASNIASSSRLTILARSDYAQSESFIRYGPIERIEKQDASRVGFFPWKVRIKVNKEVIIKARALPHVTPIVDFLNNVLNKQPNTFLASNAEDIFPFMVVYWIVFLCKAVPLVRLTEYVQLVMTEKSQGDVRKILYCMQFAGWINLEKYSGQTYYYATIDKDPFDYAFFPEVKIKDTVRRKAAVITELQNDLKLHDHVRKVATGGRGLPHEPFVGHINEHWIQCVRH